MKRKGSLFVISAVILAIAGIYGVLALQSPSTEPKMTSQSGSGADASTTGLVTMIDLGATECIPCKMMAPILVELRKEYEGRANIVFIDVWKNPDQAKKYSIKVIPTQIFYDAQGNEVQRHQGFLGKEQIIEILTELGVS